MELAKPLRQSQQPVTSVSLQSDIYVQTSPLLGMLAHMLILLH